MKCVRCKVAPAVKGTNICVPCHRKLVHKKYWPALVKKPTTMADTIDLQIEYYTGKKPKAAKK